MSVDSCVVNQRVGLSVIPESVCEVSTSNRSGFNIVLSCKVFLVDWSSTMCPHFQWEMTL